MERDRYVDFLRAFSIIVVVLGHWFIGMIYFSGGVIGTTSAIGITPWMWIGTWIFQIMPLFFFVGGFSNLVSWDSAKRKGLTKRHFLAKRMERLLKPSLVFVSVWIGIQLLLHLTETGTPTRWFLRGVHPPGATVPFGPLWFLAVYLAVVAAAPFTIWLHRRYGRTVLAVLVVGVIATDIVGFVFGYHEWRYLNVALIWLLPHQLGYFYADGRLARASKPFFVTMAAAGLLTMLLLTNPIFGDFGSKWFAEVGHYPKSLLGTDIESITNTNPPTIPMMGMTFWAIGIAMLVRPRITKWLSNERPWKAVIYGNSVIMSLFLWHMTAFLLAILVLWPRGFGRQTATSSSWWLERPLWEIVPALFLSFILVLVARFERPKGVTVSELVSGDQIQTS